MHPPRTIHPEPVHRDKIESMIRANLASWDRPQKEIEAAVTRFREGAK